MVSFVVKTLISALVIVGVAEIARRSSWIAAILASLPLTSILAMIWLYLDSRDVAKVSELSYGILWAVLPSLLFFWVLPRFLKSGIRFWFALPAACAVMFIGYTICFFAIRRIGVG